MVSDIIGVIFYSLIVKAFMQLICSHLLGLALYMMIGNFSLVAAVHFAGLLHNVVTLLLGRFTCTNGRLA